MRIYLTFYTVVGRSVFKCTQLYVKPRLTYRSDYRDCKPERMVKIPVVPVLAHIPSLVHYARILYKLYEFVFTQIILSLVVFL